MKLFQSVLMTLVALVFISGTSSAQAAAPAPAPVEKDWTIAVFLNGDNNLDQYGTADMKEMASVGSSDRVNVIVLRDTASAKTSSKIYYVQKGAQKVVKDYKKNIDMGDYRNLVEFFRYVKEQYPAKHFLIDIWNHGAGWKLKNGVDPVRGISYDDNSGNHITTPQLGEAFRQMMAINGGKKIDIFGMDACLMEMAEVGYEVADSVSYMIGSEETEPGDGWAYGQFLKPLVAKPLMTAEELAVTVEKEYVKSYNGGVQGRQDVQGSVVALDRLVEAKDKINAFTSYMISIAPQNMEAIQNAVKGALGYTYEDYKDFVHFMSLAREKIEDVQFRTLADEAINAVKGAVVYNGVVGYKLAKSTGLSIWIPDQSTFEGKKDAYGDLRWSKDFDWHKFLVTFLQ